MTLGKVCFGLSPSYRGQELIIIALVSELSLQFGGGKKREEIEKKNCMSVFGFEPLILIFYFAHKRRGALSSVRLSRSIWISGQQRLKARADCGIPLRREGPNQTMRGDTFTCQWYNVPWHTRSEKARLCEIWPNLKTSIKRKKTSNLPPDLSCTGFFSASANSKNQRHTFFFSSSSSPALFQGPSMGHELHIS